MGQVPPGFKPHPGLTKFGNQTRPDRRTPTRAERRRLLVGRGHAEHGNCWFDNTGPDGTREHLTGDPAINPAGRSRPRAPCRRTARTAGGPAYGAKAATAARVLRRVGAPRRTRGRRRPVRLVQMPAQPGRRPRAEARRSVRPSMARARARRPRRSAIDAHSASSPVRPTGPVGARGRPQPAARRGGAGAGRLRRPTARTRRAARPSARSLAARSPSSRSAGDWVAATEGRSSRRSRTSAARSTARTRASPLRRSATTRRWRSSRTAATRPGAP